MFYQGGSGWDSFAKKTAPMHDIIKKSRNIRILLAYPNSKFIKKRVDEIADNNYTLEKYRNEIFDSVDFLTDLKKRKGDYVRIKLKMYSNNILWKYIIIDSFAWIQQYSPNTHINKILAYAFEPVQPKGENKSIYEHINTQFDVFWENSNLYEYDFIEKQLKDKDGKIVNLSI